MSNDLKATKELLVKPGDTISETIEHYKMNQVELAQRMGKTPSKINDLISGKEPITIATALKLEKVLGIDAQFWINSEASYREKLSRIEQQQTLEESLDWVKQQPYKELKSCGYIKAEKPGPQMVEETLRFYGVATPEQWRTCYVQHYATVNYRKSEVHQATLGGMAAWLRMGELEMRKLTLEKFNKLKFKKALLRIRALIPKQPKGFTEKLKADCAQAGVAVVYTPCLPKAPVSGATRWIGGTPLVQLTDRFKTNDHFWFTFFHEAGHVLLHGKKNVFIEDFKGFKLNKQKEEEANAFASKSLLPESAIDELPYKPSENLIVKFAAKHKTHPGIVVGQLQHFDKLHYSEGNHLKAKICLFE